MHCKDPFVCYSSIKSFPTRSSARSECEVFRSAKGRLKFSGWGLDVISAVRTLLRQKDETTKRTIGRMMDHREERQGGQRWNLYQQNVVKFIRYQFVTTLGDELMNKRQPDSVNIIRLTVCSFFGDPLSRI